MRVAALALLAGCSALIPARLWHPSGWEAEEGHLGCPSYAYPAVDLTFGTPMLALGIASAVVATEPVRDNFFDGAVHSAAVLAAIVGFAAGALWTGSAIYGFSNEHSCRRELRAR